MRNDLGQTGFTVFPAKPQRLTTKPQHRLVTTWCETSWLFLRRAIFNFTVFKHWNFSFSILALVKQIWMTFYRKATLNQEDRISRSDTGREPDSASEKEKKWANHKQFSSVCFTCSSKGHASWLWLVVFDPNFFIAEKPLPTTRTCNVVNFHNLLSLFGQFGSLSSN